MQSKDVVMIRGTLHLHANSKGKKYLSALIKPAGTDGLQKIIINTNYYNKIITNTINTTTTNNNKKKKKNHNIISIINK